MQLYISPLWLVISWLPFEIPMIERCPIAATAPPESGSVTCPSPSGPLCRMAFFMIHRQPGSDCRSYPPDNAAQRLVPLIAFLESIMADIICQINTIIYLFFKFVMIDVTSVYIVLVERTYYFRGQREGLRGVDLGSRPQRKDGSR